MIQLPFPVTLAVNQALSSLVRANPEVRELLEQGRGGTIAIELRNPAIEIRLSLLCNTIELSSDYQAEPDVRLTAELPALLSLAETGHDPILEGRVSVTGNMSVATELQLLLTVIGSDWEVYFVPILGEALAHKLGVVLRGFASWLLESSARGNEDVGEYLQEEARMLVSRFEWRELENQSDELREQLSRLDARIQRILS